jgi:hypothetical protein
MQFVVDLNDESNTPAQLRQLAMMLLDAADAIDGGEEEMPEKAAPVLALVPKSEAPSAAEAFAPKVPVGTEADALATVEGNPPVIPPPPPVPTVAPAATAPAVIGATGTTAVLPNAPTTSPTPADARIDKDGLPHDPRIHSATPNMNSDGRWRRRRGLDNATLVAVEAELRARPMVPLPPVIPPPPTVVAAPNAPTAPVIPPPPNVLTMPVPAADTTIDPFRQLMRLIDGHTIEGGKLAPEIAKSIHAEFGATGWADYVSKCRGAIPALMGRLAAVLA